MAYSQLLGRILSKKLIWDLFTFEKAIFKPKLIDADASVFSYFIFNFLLFAKDDYTTVFAKRRHDCHRFYSP